MFCIWPGLAVRGSDAYTQPYCFSVGVKIVDTVRAGWIKWDFANCLRYNFVCPEFNYIDNVHDDFDSIKQQQLVHITWMYLLCLYDDDMTLYTSSHWRVRQLFEHKWLNIIEYTVLPFFFFIFHFSFCFFLFCTTRTNKNKHEISNFCWTTNITTTTRTTTTKVEKKFVE